MQLVYYVLFYYLFIYLFYNAFFTNWEYIASNERVVYKYWI
jgi:hypothetical protein